VTGTALGAVDSPQPELKQAVGAHAVDSERFFQESGPVTNNTTVRHRDPSIVGSEGRLDELRRVLQARLASRLGRGAVQISQGQYDRAEEVLGKEFLSTLNKYGEVAGQSSDGTGDTVERLNRTRNQQLEYAESVSEFNETYEAYREATANGNESRARQLGRELVKLGENASRQAEELNRSYSQLEADTGGTLNQAREHVGTLQLQIDTTTNEVIENEFEVTNLTVRETEVEGSFTDPLRFEASISSDGEAISNQTIDLRVGGQRYTATTDARGVFVIEYRPTATLVNNSSVDLRYLPQESSTYLGSNASVPVRIEGVTGEASLTVRTNETAFGEPFSVRGDVMVGDQPVPGLPLAVVVGGERLGIVRTDKEGEFEYSRDLPAAPAAGTQQVSVTPTAPDRAVGILPANDTIIIRETPTSLSASFTRTNTTERISGRLAANGSSPPRKQVSVVINGTRVETVQTSANGSYTVQFARGVLSGDVTVRFDATGTNLESAMTRVNIPVEQRGEGGDIQGSATNAPRNIQDWIDRIVSFLRGNQPIGSGAGSEYLRSILFSPITLVIGGVVTGAGGILLLAISRRRGDTKQQTEPGSSPKESREADGTDLRSKEFLARLPSADAISESGDPGGLVITAYGIVRNTLVDDRRAHRPQTHWQFFETCVADGVDATNLRTLTEVYESARYGAESPEETAAQEAVSAARALVRSSGAEPEADAPEPVGESGH
jgi:hypothetical protein